MPSGTNGLFEKEGGGARAGSFFSSSLNAYNLFNENEMFELGWMTDEIVRVASKI